MIILNLKPYQAKELFQKINNLRAFVRLKLKLLQFLKTSWHGNEALHVPFVCIDEETTRVFMVNGDGRKIISFSFDLVLQTKSFDLKDSGNYIERVGFPTYPEEITDRMVSEAISIAEGIESSHSKLYWDLDLYDNFNGEDIDKNSIMFFEYIATQEAGYLRYDDAPTDERLPYHPRCHIDVNYTSNISYKLGLLDTINYEDLLFMIKRETTCSYLQIHHSKYSALQFPICKKKLKKKKRKKR